MKDGPAALPPSSRDQARQRECGWKFAIEIFPPEWKLSAGPFWVAGWILSDVGGGAADVRAWLGNRLFLGLCGLPRPEVEIATLGKLGPPHAGFSFLLPPDSNAREVCFEVCDENGRWQEFHRHAVSQEKEGSPPVESTSVTETGVARALLRLLMARRNQPDATWAALADDELLADAAAPLDALPNPPFYGRLEFPQPVANVKFGWLEISGWLAHRTERIKRLVASIGPNSPVTLLHARPRNDVGGVFGELRDGPNSQFAGFIEVPRRLPQPLSLRIFAELENGEQHLAFNQRFHPQVTVESSASLPPFSRLTFGRAVAALWSASKRRHVSLGGVDGLRAGARKALEVFRSEAPVPAESGEPAPTLATIAIARPLAMILVTHNLNREGAPLIALEYAKHLAAQPGWNVRVVSPEDGPLAAEFAAAGLPVEIVDASHVRDAKTPGDFEKAIQKFSATSDWCSADLIVANTMVSFWAVHVASLLSKPSILYVHESSSVRRFFASLVAPPLLPKIGEAFGAASRVVFSAAATRAVHLGHQRRKNFCGLPGWIDTAAIAAFAATHSAAELRRAKNIQTDAIVFANVGSVCERKGQHVFLQAIELLLRKRGSSGDGNPPLVFLMVGATSGPFADFLRNEIVRRQLRDVQVVEKVAAPYEYFRLADIFVCSSFEESLPRVVMEAAAFGLPVVASAVNGVPEILGPDDAWLIPPGDAPQLADAMESALEAHLAGDRTRAERAQHKVREKFDSSILLPQHSALASAVALHFAG